MKRKDLIYTPTRREYFMARAIQGLCAGKEPKDLKHVVKSAEQIAREAEECLGSSEEDD